MKWKKAVCLQLVTLGLLMGGAFAPTRAETLSICADEWYPVNGQPGAEKPGYMIELARTILAKHHVALDYRLMPWERAVDAVRKGRFDCVVGAFHGDAPDFVFPKQEWGHFDTHFYVRAGYPWKYAGLKSLQQQKFGIIGGYAYDDVLDAYIRNNPALFEAVKGEEALEKNIRKLLAGRISVVIEAPLVMNAKLTELGVKDKIVSAGRFNRGQGIYIACSPAKESSRKYVRWFDEGISALRKSGQLARILQRYSLRDWVENVKRERTSRE